MRAIMRRAEAGRRRGAIGRGTYLEVVRHNPLSCDFWHLALPSCRNRFLPYPGGDTPASTAPLIAHVGDWRER